MAGEDQAEVYPTIIEPIETANDDNIWVLVILTFVAVSFVSSVSNKSMWVSDRNSIFILVLLYYIEFY